MRPNIKVEEVEGLKGCSVEASARSSKRPSFKLQRSSKRQAPKPFNCGMRMDFPSLMQMVSQGREVCFRKRHAECGVEARRGIQGISRYFKVPFLESTILIAECGSVFISLRRDEPVFSSRGGICRDEQRNLPKAPG